MVWPYNRTMAMGTRKMRERQEELWYGGELPKAPGHPFYQRLNEVLDAAKFDSFCETACAGFYHNRLGRPSLPPGQYFRVMMIGFFEGLDSERGIAWRLADSLTLRQFLSINSVREPATARREDGRSGRLRQSAVRYRGAIEMQHAKRKLLDRNRETQRH